jgi:hypothetical protein
MPGLQPGDDIQVQTTFPYAPLFPGITVTGTFATPIARTAIHFWSGNFCADQQHYKATQRRARNEINIAAATCMTFSL